MGLVACFWEQGLGVSEGAVFVTPCASSMYCGLWRDIVFSVLRVLGVHASGAEVVT